MKHVLLTRKQIEAAARERAQARMAEKRGDGPYAITQTGGALHFVRSPYRTYCGKEITRRLRRNPHQQLVHVCRLCKAFVH